MQPPYTACATPCYPKVKSANPLSSPVWWCDSATLRLPRIGSYFWSFATIVGALESEGYTDVHRILKCSDYGIPQMRKRLFIVGFKNVVVDDVSMFF